MASFDRRPKKTGLVRSIGVSNFLPEHINRLEKETGVLPVINQVELHPEFNQQAQREFDASKGIVTQAWSPLGRASKILQNETIQKKLQTNMIKALHKLFCVGKYN